MDKEIQELKEELYSILLTHPVDYIKALEVSKKLDEIIVKYYKQNIHKCCAS